MNQFQKSQSSKILSCYSSDLIYKSSSLPASIGEEREYDGRTYVKHVDGWVYKKKGQTRVKRNLTDHESQSTEGDQGHTSHLEQFSTLPDLRGDKRITNKVRRTLESNHATKAKSEEYKSLAKHLLEVTKPIVNDILAEARDNYKESDKEFKNDERQLMKIGTTYEVISAISNYCKEGDKIVDHEISREGNRIIADLLIERDGEEHKLSTSIIEAGGYNILQKHTRYLVTSDLPKNNSNFFSSEKIEDKELRKLKSDYKVVEKINVSKKSINKFYSKLEQLNTIKKLSLENPSITDKEGFENIFKDSLDNFINEGSFESKDYQNYAKRVFRELEERVSKRKNEGKEDIDLSKAISNLVDSFSNSYKQEIVNQEYKIYCTKATSDLPLQIKRSLSTKDFRWDKDTRTFTTLSSFSRPKIKVGNTTEPINLMNKTIRLQNPDSDKGEIFKFSSYDREKGKVHFKSTSGLNVIIPSYIRQ